MRKVLGRENKKGGAEKRVLTAGGKAGGGLEGEVGARARAFPKPECMYEAAPVLRLRRTEEIVLKRLALARQRGKGPHAAVPIFETARPSLKCGK